MQPTGAGCVRQENNSQPTVPTVQNSSVPCRCPWVYVITGATASVGTGPTRAQCANMTAHPALRQVCPGAFNGTTAEQCAAKGCCFSNVGCNNSCPWCFTPDASTPNDLDQHYWETNYTCNGSPVYQQGNRAGGMVLYQRTESIWRGSWAIGPSERRKDCATWEGVTVYADPDACDVDGCSMRPPQDVPPGAWMERTGSPPPPPPCALGQRLVNYSNIQFLGTSIQFLGKTATADACEQACRSSPSQNCTSWTWHTHDGSQGWDGDCYARSDGRWQPVPSTGTAAVASFLAAVLTEICLCNVCSCQY
jgi:hypothetical protein